MIPVALVLLASVCCLWGASSANANRAFVGTVRPPPPPEFVWEEEFADDYAAPLGSILLSSPSAGGWTNRVGTNLFTQSGKLLFDRYGFDEQIVTTNEFARASGLALFTHARHDDVNSVYGPYFGFCTNKTLSTSDAWRTLPSFLGCGFDKATRNGSIGLKVTGVDLALSDADAAIMSYAIILRTTGAFIAAREFGGDWRLVNVIDTNSLSPLRLALAPWNGVVRIPFVKLKQLTSGWEVDFGKALHRQQSPVAGTATASSNVLVQFYWTPAAAETLELSIRRTDDDNRLVLRCKQAGEIDLVSIAASVETVIDGTQTFTEGTQHQIMFAAWGSNVAAVVNGTRKFWETNDVNLTAVGVAASGFTTASNWVVWPSILSDMPSWAEPTYKTITVVGDSKSTGENLECFCWEEFDKTTTSIWKRASTRIAGAGWTVNYLRSNIDSFLSTRTNAPDVILMNYGANDVNAGPGYVLRDGTGDLWLDDLDYCLQALNTKWPTAIIWLMRPWKQGAEYQDELDLIGDTLLPAAVASHSYCRLGPDERVFLENGDDGATYTSDGIHPNTAGLMLTAQQWAALQ